METEPKPTSRFDRLCHCATSLGYALLCSFVGLLVLLGISRLQWTRSIDGVPVLDNWAVLQGIWLPAMCGYTILSWADEGNKTTTAGYGPRMALRFARTGVVLVPTMYGINAALLGADVDTKYYGLDLILALLSVVIFDATNEMAIRKGAARDQELAETATASSEATNAAVAPPPASSQRKLVNTVLAFLPVLSAVSILFLYPFVVVPTFFAGGTTTRLVIALLLHPILLEATEALTRCSKGEDTSKRLERKVITPEQAEREIVEWMLGAFGLKQIMAFYRRLMILGMGSTGWSLFAIVVTSIEQAITRGFVVEFDSAIRRVRGKPQPQGAERRLQRLVWMCDSNQSTVAELNAIVLSWLAQIFLERHGRVFALGYTAQAALDVPVAFVSLLVELTLELSVDMMVMWAEMEHGVPVTEYFRSIRTLHSFVFHCGVVVAMLTPVLYAFLRYPYVFSCSSNSICGTCLQEAPQMYEEWYGALCNATTVTSKNDTVLDVNGEQDDGEDMFEGVDPIAVGVALVTGLAMVAFIALSVVVARYRKSIAKVDSAQQAVRKAEASARKAEAYNEELKILLASAQQEVEDAVGRSENQLLKPFALKHADVVFQEQIGHGSFGVVWKGLLRSKSVAIKTLRVTKVTPSVIRDFMSEMKLMVPLRHANLVNLVGGCWQDGPDKLCLVLEFCARGSLKDLLVATQMHSLKHEWSHPFFQIAMGIASCFRYFHHEQPSGEALLHRDLKPDNVLITGDFVAKVADLGESRRFDREVVQRRRGSTAAMTMTQVGTPMYAAPEVLACMPYDISVDVYSFGVSLLEIGGRDHQFVVSQFALVPQFSTTKGWRPKPTRVLVTELPELWKLIQDCWQADAKSRPTFVEIADRIETMDPAARSDIVSKPRISEREDIMPAIASEAKNEGVVEGAGTGILANPTAEPQIKALRVTIQKKDKEIARLQRENEDLKRRLLQQHRGDDAATTLIATMRVGATERLLPPLQTIRVAATQRRKARRGSKANVLPAQPDVPVASRSSEVSALAGMLRTMRDTVEAPPSLALVEAAPTAELTLEEVLSNGSEAFGEVGEAFFPMLQKLHSDESTADFVEAFMAAHLPKGSELLVPMLRQLLEPVARDVRSAARMATQGTVLRLVLGLCVTYGDLITDVLVCVQLASEGSDLFGYAVAFIVLPLVVQALAAVVLFQQGVTDVLFALLGLKPVVESYRVWTGAAAVEWHSIKTTPELILASTKMIESAFEGFPQGALQLLYLITTPMEQWQALNFMSLATSLGAIAFALTTGAIDVDRDEHLRRNAPWLYGFTGNAREETLGQRLARYAGLFLFYVGYLGTILLGLVAAASTNISAVAAALAAIFGAYLGIKWWSGEFFLFLMPHQLWRRRSRYVISVLWHLFMLGFLLAAPAPLIRMPGFVNPHVFATAILGNLLVFSPLCLLAFHAWPPEGCGGGSSYTLGEANQTSVDLPPSISCVDSGDLFVVWACVVSLSLVGMIWFWKYGMVRAYLGTFYKTNTYQIQTRKILTNKLGNYGTNQSGALIATKQAIMARDPSYWPEDLTSTQLFKLAFPSWPEGEPKWMTDEWKRNLPSKWRGELGLVVEKE